MKLGRYGTSAFRAVTRFTHRAKTVAVIAVALGGSIAAAACHEVNTSPAALASVSFDSIPFPAIVIGDSLRDTLGNALAIHGTPFNINGDTLSDFPIRYRRADPGVTLDSLTGFVVGDTISGNAVRVLVDARGLQSPAQQLFVVPRPDTLFAARALDTLAYSLRDSTANVSTGLVVSLRHTTPDTAAVRSYAVSFRIIYPADTLLAQLVGFTRKPQRASATDVNGLASPRIFVRPGRLTSLTDSVVVEATAKYKGAAIPGSPVRLVLQLVPPGTSAPTP